MIGKKHVDTRVEPSFEKNEHYSVQREHSEDEDLHEYYVNLKKADWKVIQKIEQDMGWEKEEGKKGRLYSYIPHNTFVFVGTEEEAKKLQDHDLVYWVGARDPLHKLAGTFAKHPEDREKWVEIQKGLVGSTEEDLMVRLHFHTEITTQEQVDQLVNDVTSILDHLSIPAKVTSKEIQPQEFLIIITCESEKDAHMAALRLAPHPAVHYVDQPPVFESYNDLANLFVENGEIIPDAMGGDNDDYVRDRSDSPLNFLDGAENGVTYLVGLADTGIDWDNCMFYDGTPQFNGASNDNSHRKIVNYDTTYGDRFDGVWHGTHMAGTLAGAEIRGSASYPIPEGTLDGLVPEAKIIFADLSTGGSDNINVPEGISDLFDLTFLRGSKVNVYGWGTRILSEDGVDFYNDLDFRTDSYCFENPFFMAFFPTGNRQFNRFPLVLSTPASSKNTFAIASTRSFHESVTRWYGRTGDENRDLYNYFHNQICSTSVFWWNDPAFCASFGFSSPCQNFQNTNICPNFQSVNDCCRFSYFQPLCCDSFFQENWNNTEVRSEVLFNEHVLDGQGNHGPMFDQRYGVDLVFPGTNIVSANSDQNTGTRNCGNNAGVKVLNGTSMSAAVAGGAAIKILQYFEQGYYPWGDSSRTDAEAFSPSTSLMKALMMASTVSMTSINGNQRQYYFDSHDSFLPNDYEGMGAPVLKRVLHVYEPPADTNGNLNVAPYGFRRISVGRSDTDPNHLFLNSDGFWRGCFRASLDARHFSVTIAWNDRPANRNSAFALVNNMDMAVMPLLGEAMWTGNNQQTGFDTRNNYEHVEFDSLATAQINYSPCPPNSPVDFCVYQQYAIEVKGQPLIDLPSEVPFSLVVHAWQTDTAGNELAVQVLELGVTGDTFNGLALNCEADTGLTGSGVLCPRDCSGYGDCGTDGQCTCYEGYTGLDCSLSVCEDDCNNAGVCDGETGACDCVEDYAGTTCAIFDPPVAPNVSYVPTNCTCDCPEDQLAVGAAVGIAIGAFILGLFLGAFLGAFIGIKWLIARKRRKVAELKQKLAARDNMAGGDAGVDPDGP
eukprot:CAMPEP_0201519158 /NCGR_PEP_ID=MMETSP0161_2-20130828/9782_1 /ASSEMBLY_ACC=CAM_ASM_000251 /TAXON_ID=180227 /ORGANISM="Neoparamoeba aestuarina, Strain SoJaBio B1-5/56/2" /LENGTH=1055 /DNA_ID=CAMNT_0047917109 /DNA_START=322 /DNA_END=3489 /DNA_ORIENTATION=+